eukprot:910335-Pelagomonas_calceolata.AAC.3
MVGLWGQGFGQLKQGLTLLGCGSCGEPSRKWGTCATFAAPPFGSPIVLHSMFCHFSFALLLRCMWPSLVASPCRNQVLRYLSCRILLLNFISRFRLVMAMCRHKRRGGRPEGKPLVCLSQNAGSVQKAWENVNWSGLAHSSHVGNSNPASALSGLAHEVHAHFVKYAPKLVTTRHTSENKNTRHSQFLEPGATSSPPDLH